MITRNRAFGFVLTAVAALVLSGSSAQAQSGTRSYGENLAGEFRTNSGINRYSSSTIRNTIASRSVTRDRAGRPDLGSYRPSSSAFNSKPFSTISRAPSVSPYLALSNSFNQVSDYYNIVRPIQNQRRINQNQQRQNQSNLRRLNQLAAQGPYSPRGDDTAAPTGHGAAFQSLGTYLNTGGYFSGAPVPRQ